MPEERPGDVSDDGLARVDREVEAYERLADRDGIALRPYWTRSGAGAGMGRLERLFCLGALVKADLRRRFDRGESPAVREYLDDFPEIREADSRVLSLLYEEYCLREERGEAVDADSFCERYPDWKESLASQLGYHKLLSRAAGLVPPKPDFPEAGADFEEFALLSQIGKGGYSRVFLAGDRSLGGKRVVLKVSIDRGREAEAQGALDHPHIVPVNSVAYKPEGDLRGLSMPYRPGLPLDAVIHGVRRGGARPTSAAALWDAMAAGIAAKGSDLDAESAAALRDGPTGDGWRGFPSRGSFAQGVAWIGMVIARALAYAHGRRTFHRDVKPGNVLVTVQHGPQLLDFNLAESPHSPQEAQAAIQGGTLPYMAPEQIAAFLDPARWGEVGAAADVYALGLVLHELLTGEQPDVPDPKLPPPRAMQELKDRREVMEVDVRRFLPHAPHALEEIVRKCLRPDPEDRYPGAAELADDLERTLQRRPTVHVANPSRAERLRDWAARNRRVLITNAIYLGVLAALSPLLIRQAALALRPDVEDRPELRAAADALDADHPETAVPLLEALAREYPASPVPPFYLGIAQTLADAPAQDPGRTNYRAAVKSAWKTDPRRLAERHPNLPNLLAKVGERWVDDAGEMRVRARRGDDPAAAAAIEPTRELAEHALKTALELDPESVATLHALATIDETRGEFEAAHEKLSRLLTAPPPASSRPSGLYDVMTWRLQRARVAVQIASRAESRGEPDRLAHGLELADEAVADLEARGGEVPDFVLPVFQALRAETFLTRGELRCRLDDAAGAADDARQADSAMKVWFQSLRLVGGDDLVQGAERYRRRLRELQNRVAALPADKGAG